MQLFSYNPHPFFSKAFFKLFLAYFCLNNMICYFPQHVSCFILLLACSQFRSMFFHACLYVIRLDLHASCFMPCFLYLDLLFPMFLMLDPHASMSHTSVCAQIYLFHVFFGQIHMFLCLFTCLFFFPTCFMPYTMFRSFFLRC